MSRVGIALCLLAALILAPTAVGQGGGEEIGGGEDLVPWPQALPPEQIPNEVRPHPVERCRKATLRCIRGLERRLRRQYRRFDATCDHRAVIAYSYLQITRGLRLDMTSSDSLVRHKRWMAYLVTNFSNRYFRAFRNYRRGRPVPEAWRITFETAAHGDANAGQDVLLFSNVHVQHDLPLAYETQGLLTRSGRSRKPDHDAVNAINARIFDDVEEHIAANYDPSFTLIDLPFLPLEEVTTLELVKSWREQAWRSAERLLAARNRAERQQVVETMRRTSIDWARMISSGGLPGWRETRDEYCRTR